MIKRFYLFSILCVKLISNAQSIDSIDFSVLYNTKNYDELISKVPKKPKELSAMSLYYIGMAYYMKSNDAKAMEYLDYAIDKGPVNQDMYYYKGMIYFYGNKYSQALKYVNKAMAIFPSELEFYYTKAEIFQAMDNKDSAINNAYISAKSFKTMVKSQILLGNLFKEKKDYVKAFSAYQKALEGIKPGTETYKKT